MAVHTDTHAKHAHPALFALLVMPFGIIVGYSDVALSYVFGERGLSTELSGVVIGLVGLPHAWKWLWAPALDAGTKRKTWFFSAVVVAAIAVAFAAMMPPDPFMRFGPFTRLEAFCVLVLIAEAAAATSSAAVDSLMAITLPNEKKGAAAGWSMAGNLGATFTGGAAIIWLSQHVASRATQGLILGGIVLACGIPGLFIAEPQPERHPAWIALKNLVKDVWRTVLSREGWTGLVICLTPVGTGGVTKLFGELAEQYIPNGVAREHSVELVNGVAGGIVSALGCLAGGYLADKMNRRLLYVSAGLLTALSAIAMAIAPANETTYAIGCLAYQLFNGVCYAAFAAFVLEMIGHGPGVTTKYQLFVGASNLAISYVTVLDGMGERIGENIVGVGSLGKRVGVLGMDAAATFVGIAIVGAMVLYLKQRPLAIAPLTSEDAPGSPRNPSEGAA